LPDYQRFHIADINIDDEQLSNNGRDITVVVDTLERVNIEIGNSLIIRTDYNGLHSLRHILHDASIRLDRVSGDNKARSLTEKVSETVRSEGDLTESQTHDVFDITGYPV
jgi:hypothetical protein